MYGVSFVDPAYDWYSASVPVIIYVISYNIGPHNGTQLYMAVASYSCFMDDLSQNIPGRHWVNTMTADDLAPYVARPSAAMIDKQKYWFCVRYVLMGGWHSTPHQCPGDWFLAGVHTTGSSSATCMSSTPNHICHINRHMCQHWGHKRTWEDPANCWS